MKYLIYFHYSTSKVLKVYNLPTHIVTNLAFGGPYLDELFVLSSRLPFNLFTGQIDNDPLTSSAGSMFIIKNVNAKGYNGGTLYI